jgi:hypothetical protein
MQGRSMEFHGMEGFLGICGYSHAHRLEVFYRLFFSQQAMDSESRYLGLLHRLRTHRRQIYTSKERIVSGLFEELNT